MEEITVGKGEETRQSVLQAAYSLFLEQGYAATSMRQISDRCGLSLGAIYNHFKSKETIFSELIISRHPFHQILPMLQSTPGNTAEEFIRNATSKMVEELGRRPDFIKLLFVELVEFNGRDLPQMFQVIYPEVTQAIEKIQSYSLEFRSVPPFTLFRIFMGLIFSFYMTEFILKDTPVSGLQDNTLDRFVDVFLLGILLDKEQQ